MTHASTILLTSSSFGRVRYDRPNGREELGRGLFFGLGRQGSRSILTSERRTEERFDTPGCWSGLGWRTWRGFRVRHALVINISRRGAFVFLDEPPPPRRRLWLYLETVRDKAVVPARVCEVLRTRQGQAAVRILFAHRCPYDLFEAAVCGLPPVDPRHRAGRSPARG